MPLIIFVGIASAGALFMIYFIAAVNRDEQRRNGNKAHGFIPMLNALGISAGPKPWPACVVKVSAEPSSGKRGPGPVVILRPQQNGSVNRSPSHGVGLSAYAGNRSRRSSAAKRLDEARDVLQRF
jgi:hypothetical protein